MILIEFLYVPIVIVIIYVAAYYERPKKFHGNTFLHHIRREPVDSTWPDSQNRFPSYIEGDPDYEVWVAFGNIHRTDGPAISSTSGRCQPEWYWKGYKQPLTEWIKNIKDPKKKAIILLKYR